jgi:hypothetical protein
VLVLATIQYPKSVIFLDKNQNCTQGKLVRPSNSTHSKPRTTIRTRLLKCFVLITLCCKTKHLKAYYAALYAALNE